MHHPRAPIRAAAASVFILLAATQTAATPSTARLTDAQLTARGNAISNRIMQLEMAGASDDAIESVMVEEFGVQPLPRVGTESDVTILSSGGDCVSLPAPRAYYDVQAGAHALSASWQWKNRWDGKRCWVSDVSVGGGNVGGPDAFGVYLDTAGTYKSSGGNSYTETGTRYSMINPEDWNGSGVVFRVQDKSNSGSRSYTWDHGNIWMYFNIKSCPVTFTLKSKLGHTWSSTSVTEATVGTTGVSLTFSSTANRWQAVNPVAGSYFVC